MKKLLILAAFAAALLAGSCAFWFEYEITVRNRTGHAIEVAISQSSSSPGSFTDIPNGDKRVFTVEWDEHYVYVRRNGSPVKKYYDKIDIHSNDTWTIRSNWVTGYEVDY